MGADVSGDSSHRRRAARAGLAAVEVLLCLSLFTACALQVRLRLRLRAAAQGRPGQAGA